MRKPILLFCLTAVSFINAQSLCETMAKINGDFLNASSEAVQNKVLLNSDAGPRFQQRFDTHLQKLEKVGSEFKDERNLMNFLKVKAVAGFAYYLFSTNQIKELQNLSAKSVNLLDHIYFDEYDQIPCKGAGYADVKYFDEESETYYTANALTSITKFSASKKDLDKICGMIYPYFSYANFVQGDVKKGEEFFLKNFDERFFYGSKDGLMTAIAQEILTKYNDKNPITNLDFAAAATYIYFYDPAKAKSENEKKIAAIFYGEAMSILKRDDQFSTKIKKGETLALSNPTARAQVYGILLNSLNTSTSNDKTDVIAMMKRYFEAEKKTGRSSIELYHFAKMFYSDSGNNDQLTNAVLADNDPVFMTEVSDRLLKHFKEYDTYTAGNTIYQVHVFYKKAGQNAKAKKAFNMIHEKFRGNYREL